MGKLLFINNFFNNILSINNCIYIFLLKTNFKRDDYVFEGLFGTFSRYHFIPILCGTCLFLSGIFKDSIFRGWNGLKSKGYIDAHLGKYIADLIFSCLGVASLTLIKYTIKLEKPFYIVYIIKDGFFSILLALYTYSFFYASAYIGFLNQYEKCIKSREHAICDQDNSDAANVLKHCGMIFSLLVGLVNLVIAIFLKDFIISVMNAVIYLGLLIFFYSIKGERKDEMDPPKIEGILDLIVFVCSLVGAAYIVYLKCKNSNNSGGSSVKTPLTIDEEN